MPHIVEEIKCRTFDEFLEKLRPSNEIWDETTWVFRGHESSNYELLPTLFRTEMGNPLVEDLFAKYKADIRYSVPRELGIRNQQLINDHRNGFDSLVYYNIERHLIYEFARMANDAGLPVPDLVTILQNMSAIVANLGEAIAAFGETEFKTQRITSLDTPFYEPNEAVSLAQHHGIPTRLLDFTTDPLRAVFFASKPGESDEICVWAVRLPMLSKGAIVDIKKYERYTEVNDLFSEYGVLEVSTANNEYLKNQRGLFLYPKFPFEFYTINGRFPTLVNFMEAFYGRRDVEMPFRPLRKITLPRNQVPELRAKIKREQISLTRLMPSFDNIKNDMLAELHTPFRNYKFLWQKLDVGKKDTLIQAYSVLDLRSEADLIEFCKFKKKFCPVKNGYRIYFGHYSVTLTADPDMGLVDPGKEINHHIKAVYRFKNDTGASDLFWYGLAGTGSVLSTIPI